MDVYSCAIGDVVISEVAVRGWSQAELEKRFGMSRGTYRGSFQTCSTAVPLRTVVRVAEALGMTAGQLIARAEERIKRGDYSESPASPDTPRGRSRSR